MHYLQTMQRLRMITFSDARSTHHITLQGITSLSVRGFRKLSGSSSLQRQSNNDATAPAVALHDDGITLQDAGHPPEVFNSTWLRHNCRCPACIEISSGQKLLTSSVLAQGYPFKAVSTQITPENVVEVSFANDPHRAIFPIGWLQQRRYLPPSFTPIKPTRHIPTVSFDEIMSGKEGQWKWLSQLAETGASLVKVNTDVGTVSTLAKIISHPQTTIYGEDFDVVSTENPVNIAYTSLGLELHHDLVYYESPPGLQFLHCLQFDDDVVGGESLLVDVFYAAEELRRVDAASFDVLAKVPATFQKIHYSRAMPVHIDYQRPHIQLSVHGQVNNVFWAPPFEGPLQASPQDTKDYYHAYAKFSSIINSPDLLLKFRLNPGEALTFNNRRMVHGRAAYFATRGGKRHLQGAYVNIDEFKSKLGVLATQLGVPVPRGHVGNSDHTPM